MSKQAVALIAALLVVAGLLVAGCGGDDDNDASAGSPAAETTSADADSGSDSSSEGSDEGEADAGGDEGDEGGEETATITKAALIKQGDQLCVESEKSVATQGSKLFEDADKDSGDFQLQVVGEVIGPEFLALADDLEDLGAPSGDEAQVEALVAVIRERGELASEDPQGFLDLEGERGGPLEKKAFQLAKQYGFKQCMQA